jgi:hypothetical protein
MIFMGFVNMRFKWQSDVILLWSIVDTRICHGANHRYSPR